MPRRAGSRLIALATGLGALLGFLQAHALPVRWNRGPESRWWESLRRSVSIVLGRVFDARAGPRPITAGEYAGTLPLSLAETERLLWRAGFVRNPFSRLKRRDGEPELGSWVARDSPLARRQVHVMLFPAPGGVDVYAHEEYSSVHPLVGSSHFDGATQNVAIGVERARERLPLEIERETVDPPAGPWNSPSDGVETVREQSPETDD